MSAHVIAKIPWTNVRPHLTHKTCLGIAATLMLGCFHIQVFAENVQLEASQMPVFVRNQVTLTNIT